MTSMDIFDAASWTLMIARTMMGLAECANHGLLTDDQHFEFGKAIEKRSRKGALAVDTIGLGRGGVYNEFCGAADAPDLG